MNRTKSHHIYSWQSKSSGNDVDLHQTTLVRHEETSIAVGAVRVFDPYGGHGHGASEQPRAPTEYTNIFGRQTRVCNEDDWRALENEASEIMDDNKSELWLSAAYGSLLHDCISPRYSSDRSRAFVRELLQRAAVNSREIVMLIDIVELVPFGLDPMDAIRLVREFTASGVSRFFVGLSPMPFASIGDDSRLAFVRALAQRSSGSLGLIIPTPRADSTIDISAVTDIQDFVFGCPDR